MSANPKHRWTVEEYLEFERTSEVKHEFVDGEIFQMAGASADHNRITANTIAALIAGLGDQPCDILGSDMRVRISAGHYAYPDIVIVCGEPQLENTQPETLLNPTVIVEVLSPSTENYDRGKKFEAYRRLESLREYVLIAQDRPYIERYVRGDDGSSWTLTDARGLDAEMALVAVPAALRLADVYRRVTFESTDSSIDL
jgi:Uma2 family endonuclease